MRLLSDIWLKSIVIALVFCGYLALLSTSICRFNAQKAAGATVTATSVKLPTPTAPATEPIATPTHTAAKQKPQKAKPAPVNKEPACTYASTITSTDAGRLRSLGRFKLTAYCPCERCCGKWARTRPLDANGKPIIYTASGARAQAGVSISVDPKIIPYGTEVVIDGHKYIAHDCGGGIKGNRIDVYFDSHEDAWNFGAKYKEVYILQ